MQEPKKRGRPRQYDNPKQARQARNRRNREYMSEQIAAGFTRVSLLVPRSDVAEFQELAKVKRKLALEARKKARPGTRRSAPEKVFSQQDLEEGRRLYLDGYGLSDFRMAGMDAERIAQYLADCGDVGSSREALIEMQKRDGAGPLKFMRT